MKKRKERFYMIYKDLLKNRNFALIKNFPHVDVFEYTHVYVSIVHVFSKEDIINQ